MTTMSAPEAKPAEYYAKHADEFGWGPGRQLVDPVRADALARYATGTRALDIGCGAGTYVDFMAGRGFRMVGVDFTGVFLEQAIASGYRGTFACADVLHLPFRDKTFDSVSLLTVLEHIPDDLAALREAARIARRRLVIMVPQVEDDVLLQSGLCLKNRIDSSHVHYYSPEGLRALIERAGCRVVAQYPVNAVAIRYLVYRSLRLPPALIWAVRLFLKLLPWRDHYNECVTIADVT